MLQLNLSGLAQHTLEQPCDGCGNYAVELAIVRESDPFPATMHFCRVCIGDDASDPALEWISGEPIDAAARDEWIQTGLLEVAPTSTFEPGAAPMRGDTSLF